MNAQTKRWLAAGVGVTVLAATGCGLWSIPSIGCRLGREEACATVAQGFVDQGDPDSARAIYVQLCQSGRASACLAAGRIDWAASRKSEAITMWRQGCEAQPPSGDPGAEVPCPPIVWARADTACRAGDETACPVRNMLGLKHQLVEAAPACAALLPDCRAGDEEACAVLGWRCR